MRTAKHDIDQQNEGGNAQRPGGIETEHDFEHDDTGYQLTSEIEEQYQ